MLICDSNGCNGNAKVCQGKLDFIQCQGKSGQGVSKSLFKVCEKSGNFILRMPMLLNQEGSLVLKII